MVYIVIINYNNWNDTVEAIDNILKLDYDDFKIILIDNASINQSVKHIHEWCLTKQIKTKIYNEDSYEKSETETNQEKITIIQNTKNYGYAGGLNVFLQNVTKLDANIWLLNPDMHVEPNSLFHLINCQKNLGKRTIIGSRVYKYSTQEIDFLAGSRIGLFLIRITNIKHKGNIDNLSYINGGNLFVHTSAFNEIGLFPEQYFLYWEESDWCRKGKSLGYTLELCDQSVATNKGSTTIGRGKVAHYYYTRNGLFFLTNITEI